MTKSKKSFFSQFVDSIKNFEKYPEFAIKSMGEVLSYLIKLLLIFTISISIIYTFKIAIELNNIIDYISEEIPDFSFIDNKLNISNNEPIKKENKTKFFDILIFDTMEIDEIKLKQYKNNLLDSDNGIAFLENKFLLKTNVTDGIIEYNYQDIINQKEDETINKDQIIEYFKGTSKILIYIVIFIFMVMYLFLLNIIKTFFDVIILAIFGHIATLFMKFRIRFDGLCRLAIYSLTLPIILNIVSIFIEIFTGFNIKYFDFMYMGIACIYIATAISMIRMDIIKNKQELLNIIEEQKRVKEELERQEKEKEREQEENKEENKGKKDNKQNEDDKEKEEPQGEET